MPRRTSAIACAVVAAAVIASPIRGLAQSATPANQASAAGPGATAGGRRLSAQLSTRFKVDDANPEDSIPNSKDRDRNPLEFGYLLQDLLERAEQARKDRDFPAVIRYYRAVAKAVPENAKGWSKLCEAYEIVNDRERAIRACRYAIDRPAAELQDFTRYIHLIIGRPGDLDNSARTELAKVLEHLDTQPDVKVAANHLRCEVAIKLEDAVQLEACTKALAAVAPDDPKTVVFQWTLAMMTGKTEQAKELLVRARAVGVAHDGIERMESVVYRPARFSARTRAAAIAALAMGALGVFLILRRRRGLNSRAAA